MRPFTLLAVATIAAIAATNANAQSMNSSGQMNNDRMNHGMTTGRDSGMSNNGMTTGRGSGMSNDGMTRHKKKMSKEKMRMMKKNQMNDGM